MSWLITPGWSPADADAAAYITAVETADNQALENGVKVAIDNFVLGCKADGIWSAIKASCILAGARTRLGALTPLVGTASTSFNFVDGDYNRKTGLAGNGSNKYLDSGRLGNADPENNFHGAVYASTVDLGGMYMGSGTSGAHTIQMGARSDLIRCQSNVTTAAVSASTGLVAVSRSQSSFFLRRASGATATLSVAFAGRSSGNILLFARGVSGTPDTLSNARLAFYSMGESLNLALLDARVTTLINAFAAAIP
jgi:hypothetical protein